MYPCETTGHLCVSPEMLLSKPQVSPVPGSPWQQQLWHSAQGCISIGPTSALWTLLKGFAPSTAPQELKLFLSSKQHLKGFFYFCGLFWGVLLSFCETQAKLSLLLYFSIKKSNPGRVFETRNHPLLLLTALFTTNTELMNAKLEQKAEPRYISNTMQNWLQKP